MKQRFLHPAVLALAALPLTGLAALAQEGGASACAPVNAEAAPALEEAKSHVLAGDYAGFFNAVAPGNDPASEQMKKALEGLEKISKDGFTTCSTLVHRVEDSGLVQEVVFFGDGEGPALSLYISSANIGDKPAIVSFLLSPDFENAFEKLR